MRRLAIPQTDRSRKRPRPLPWFDPRLKGIADGPKANAKKWNVQSKISDQKLTAREYATLQDAYDYFNRVLFDSTLPQVLITLQRRGKTLGYFSAERFQSRDGIRSRVHEVALNPEGFRGESDEEILSTLAHEMVHVWQKEHGRAGRGRYHNRQFAAKMHSIGLMPSATGKPGGAATGDHMSHYILPEGRFIISCSGFLQRYRLTWESAIQRKEESGPEPDEEGESTQTRAKFTCPNCGLNAWAKPDARLVCHDCSMEAGELINMPKQPERTSRD
jgi:hypothetical protein